MYKCICVSVIFCLWIYLNVILRLRWIWWDNAMKAITKKKMKYHWEADKHGLNRKFTTHFEWWTDYSFKCLISIDWKMKSRHKTLLLPYISSRWKKKWEARKKSSIVKEKRHWWIGVVRWFCVFWKLRRGFFFFSSHCLYFP